MSENKIKITNIPTQRIGVNNSNPVVSQNIVAKEIIANGKYNATEEGATGYNPVIVNIDMQTSYNEGYQDGYGAGFAEYDRFWDAYQQNGARENYSRSFNGHGWTIDTFKPKYTIHPTVAQYMFEDSNIPIDLAQCLEDLGISLDLSRCIQYNGMFYTSKFTRIPKIVDRMVSNAVNLFSACGNLVTIDEIELEKDITNDTHYRDAFYGCNALENIKFTGVGKLAGNISFADSPNLTRESIVSILEALANNLSATKTLTFASESSTNQVGFERKLKDQIVGNDAVNHLDKTKTTYFPPKSGTTDDGITYDISGSGIEFTGGGTTTAETRINLLNTPIIFPKTPSDIVKEMSLQGIPAPQYGSTCEYGYLRATVQRTDGTEDEWYLAENSLGYFYQGDTITSIDLVIPEGATIVSGTFWTWYIYIDYLYWLEETLLYRNCWNIIY